MDGIFASGMRVQRWQQGRRLRGEIVRDVLAPLGKAGHGARVIGHEAQVRHEVGAYVLEVDL